jgi:hypothetical protein
MLHAAHTAFDALDIPQARMVLTLPCKSLNDE